MPCPKCKKLEAGHGKLGDLVSRSVPPWLPDGTAELLDDVLGEVSEYIQSHHHLVVVEGFRRPLAEKKDSLEHVSGGRADPGLEGRNFHSQGIVAVFVLVLILDSRFIRVLALVTPSLLTSFAGFILSTRHQHFLPGLGAQASSPRPGQLIRSSHCRWSSPVRSDDVSHQSVDRATVVAGQWSMIRAGGRAAV
jgi:hypothetical protein